MKGLTKRQSEIIDFIQDFIHDHRFSPSYREIMQHFGFSCIGTVSKHIQALKRKGVLSNEKNCSRSISLTEVQQKFLTPAAIVLVPTIGSINGEGPIEFYSQPKMVPIAQQFINNPNSTYVLLVEGDTFEEEMISRHDLLIIEARQTAEEGETVIALINEHQTVIKKYFPFGTYIKLIGHNPHHHPLVIREENIAIQAVLIGLIRGLSI